MTGNLMHRARTILLVPLLSACFQYSRATPMSTAVGTTVRVELSDAGTAAVSPSLGPSLVTITGDVMQASADTLTLAVTSGRTRTGAMLNWTGIPAAVPVSGIDDLQERRFSRRRSLLFGGAALAATVAVVALVANSESEGSTAGNPQPRPQP